MRRTGVVSILMRAGALRREEDATCMDLAAGWIEVASGPDVA
jgi:hypothetical protein